MPDPELDALIVKNIGDLDAAARYLGEDLKPRLGAAMDEVFQTFWRKSDWEGSANWDEDETWIAARDWRDPEGSKGNEFKCKVWLWGVAGQGGGEDHFWLTYLLGAGVQSLGLQWNRTNLRNKRAWRRTVSLQRDIVARLRAHGFEYEEALGTFLLPVRIDRDELATALQDESPEQALGPLEQALRQLLEAKDDFDALLASAIEDG